MSNVLVELEAIIVAGLEVGREMEREGKPNTKEYMNDHAKNLANGTISHMSGLTIVKLIRRQMVKEDLEKIEKEQAKQEAKHGQ